jgi:general secretion pathway protein I
LSRAMPSERRCSAGFTLIEALVALTVVATSLAAIGALMATSVRGVRSLEQHVALVETARTVAANLPRRDELGAGFTGAAMGYRWRVETSVLSTETGPAANQATWLPQVVAVTVRSPSGATLQIDTVRLVRRPGG